MMVGNLYKTKLPVGPSKWWCIRKGIPLPKNDLNSGLGIVVIWPDKSDMQPYLIFKIHDRKS